MGPLCAGRIAAAGLPPGVVAAELRRFERDFWQGFVVKAFGDPAARLAVIGRHQHLGCEAQLGSRGSLLGFDGPECCIRLHGRLPDTVVGAVVGRTVAKVVKHEALADSRAMISRVEQRGRFCRLWFTDQRSLIEARVRVFTDGRHPPF